MVWALYNVTGRLSDNDQNKSFSWSPYPLTQAHEWFKAPRSWTPWQPSTTPSDMFGTVGRYDQTTSLDSHSASGSEIVNGKVDDGTDSSNLSDSGVTVDGESDGIDSPSSREWTVNERQNVDDSSNLSDSGVTVEGERESDVDSSREWTVNERHDSDSEIMTVDGEKDDSEGFDREVKREKFGKVFEGMADDNGDLESQRDGLSLEDDDDDEEIKCQKKRRHWKKILDGKELKVERQWDSNEVRKRDGKNMMTRQMNSDEMTDKENSKEIRAMRQNKEENKTRQQTKEMTAKRQNKEEQITRQQTKEMTTKRQNGNEMKKMRQNSEEIRTDGRKETTKRQNEMKKERQNSEEIKTEGHEETTKRQNGKEMNKKRQNGDEIRIEGQEEKAKVTEIDSEGEMRPDVGRFDDKELTDRHSNRLQCLSESDSDRVDRFGLLPRKDRLDFSDELDSDELDEFGTVKRVDVIDSNEVDEFETVRREESYDNCDLDEFGTVSIDDSDDLDEFGTVSRQDEIDSDHLDYRTIRRENEIEFSDSLDSEEEIGQLMGDFTSEDSETDDEFGETHRRDNRTIHEAIFGEIGIGLGPGWEFVVLEDMGESEDWSETIRENLSETIEEDFRETIEEDFRETIEEDFSETIEEDLSKTTEDNLSEAIKEGLSEAIDEGLSENIEDNLSETTGENFCETTVEIETIGGESEWSEEVGESEEWWETGRDSKEWNETEEGEYESIIGDYETIKNEDEEDSDEKEYMRDEISERVVRTEKKIGKPATASLKNRKRVTKKCRFVDDVRDTYPEERLRYEERETPEETTYTSLWSLLCGLDTNNYLSRLLNLRKTNSGLSTSFTDTLASWFKDDSFDPSNPSCSACKEGDHCPANPPSAWDRTWLCFAWRTTSSTHEPKLSFKRPHIKRRRRMNLNTRKKFLSRRRMRWLAKHLKQPINFKLPYQLRVILPTTFMMKWTLRRRISSSRKALRRAFKVHCVLRRIKRLDLQMPVRSRKVDLPRTLGACGGGMSDPAMLTSHQTVSPTPTPSENDSPTPRHSPPASRHSPPHPTHSYPSTPSSSSISINPSPVPTHPSPPHSIPSPSPSNPSPIPTQPSPSPTHPFPTPTLSHSPDCIPSIHTPSPILSSPTYRSSSSPTHSPTLSRSHSIPPHYAVPCNSHIKIHYPHVNVPTPIYDTPCNLTPIHSPTLHPSTKKGASTPHYATPSMPPTPISIPATPSISTPSPTHSNPSSTHSNPSKIHSNPSKTHSNFYSTPSNLSAPSSINLIHSSTSTHSLSTHPTSSSPSHPIPIPSPIQSDSSTISSSPSPSPTNSTSSSPTPPSTPNSTPRPSLLDLIPYLPVLTLKRLVRDLRTFLTDPVYRLAERKKNDGNELYKQEEYRDALKLYTQAIDLCPDCAAYYSNRSACYMMLGKYSEALNDAREAVRLDKAFVKGYLRVAKCNIALGDATAAQVVLRQASELDPSNRSIREENARANNLLRCQEEVAKATGKNDYRTAIFHLDRALELAVGCRALKITKAEYLVFLHRYGDAQDIVNEILQFDSSNADAIYVRGMCLYYQDNPDSAFQHFQQVLRLAPDHYKARQVYKKAKLLKQKKEEGNEAFKRGSYHEAYNCYTEALAIDPLNKHTNAKLYFNRATVGSKINKVEEAVVDCTAAINLDEGYIKAYLRRAKCYQQLEKYEEAVRDYEKVTRLDRSHEHKRLLQEAKIQLKRSKRKDYYKILGVNKTASDDDIKKSYKKLALVHHPDRHANASEKDKQEHEVKFKEIGEAYSVLTDGKKRAMYDRGQDLNDPDGGFAHEEFDPNQIFQAFFGGGGGHGGYSFGGHGGFPQGGGFPGSGFSSGGSFPGGFHFQFG